MKEIPLTRGCVALIDDADYERVAAFHDWYVDRQGYARRKTTGARGVRLHRFILNYDGPLEIDHINHDPLDNRRCNLRIVPRWVNQLNRRKPVVGAYRNGNGWQAKVSVNSHSITLGTYPTKEEAQQARENHLRDMLADPERLYKLPTHRRNNVSGVVGVCFNRRMNRWKAKIDAQHLGYFVTKEEAVTARKAAEQEADALAARADEENDRRRDERL